MSYKENYLLNKKVKIYQPDNGYHASIDAVFLSALIDNAHPKEQILDIGSGTGAVSLCLAYRFPQCKITGLEIQPYLAELSNLSAKSNNFNNLEYINCDIRHPINNMTYCSYHHVITNPPYSNGYMPSPNLSKALAHDFQQFDLPRWLSFSLKMIRPKGYFYTINRTEALDSILSCLYGKVGDITIIPLYSKEGQPANRILIRARKASHAPTKIMSGFIIHNPDGSYTKACEYILRDGKSLFNF